MTAAQIVEGFSLTHAQILDGATAFSAIIAANYAAPPEQDIYGVNNASITPNTAQWENTGDDDVLSNWQWFNYAEVAVQAGFVSFPQVAAMTGQTISSSGSGNTLVMGLDLWHEDAQNVDAKPMIVQMRSRDAMGKVRRLTIGLYRVDFGPITFDGPQYKEGLKINYTGRVSKTAYDEKGVAFADGKKRAGRILSHA